ncbi:TraX family protein [Nesterenkonia rhizosphaerae]|uniref:Conjugal transfer protein TraX n=1 Tax=Nesterenkonia rhizosphaerae TaxID=1348272 RepID=A0ABP9G024_9MICC
MKPLDVVLGQRRSQPMMLLKLTAVITMILDHVGFVYDIDALRIVGRFAFPAFAYLLVTGFQHTSSRRRYLVRLLVFAVFAQVPYYLLFEYGHQLNILFTLALGLCALSALGRPGVVPLVVIPVAFLGSFAVEYGAYGLLLIMIIYWLYRRPLLLCAAACLLTCLSTVLLFAPTQYFAALALPLVLLLARHTGSLTLPKHLLLGLPAAPGRAPAAD